MAAETKRAGHDPVELVATVLLTIAAVATAWSSYQAARWNGEQVKTTSRVNEVRIDAARAEGEAEAEAEVDVATFIAWVDARAAGEEDLEEFYEDRFRPEFKSAFDAWLDVEPFTSDDAPPTPFAMPDYRQEAADEAARLDAEAERLAAQVHRDVQRSTDYMLTVVLFAVALFFAGMSTQLHGPRARTTVVAVGSVMFLLAAGWVATFPVSVSI